MSIGRPRNKAYLVVIITMVAYLILLKNSLRTEIKSDMIRPEENVKSKSANENQDRSTTQKVKKELTAPQDSICIDPDTGEVIQFAYQLPNTTRLGKKFDCKYLKQLKELDLINPSNVIDWSKEEGHIEPVFVTAFNTAFFENGRHLIASVRRHFPKQLLIVYDLGFTDKEVDTIKNLCHVEYRKFNFSFFLSENARLTFYQWKPILIAETLKTHKSLWYMDSSVEWKHNKVDRIHKLIECHKKDNGDSTVLSAEERDKLHQNETVESGWSEKLWRKNVELCQKSEILLQGYSGHGIFAVTHPDVFKYIPSDLTELRKPKAMNYDANFILAVKTRTTTTQILKWWVLCALDRDCMAPEGSQLRCMFGDDRYTDYAQCHRYDQSVLNILLANQNHYDHEYYVSQVVDFFDIERARTRPSPKDADLHMQPECS